MLDFCRQYDRSEGYARTGYWIPGCDGKGDWMPPGNSSAAAVAAAVAAVVALWARARALGPWALGPWALGPSLDYLMNLFLKELFPISFAKLLNGFG